MIDGLHLLRPWWLLALPVAAALVWRASRASDSERAWRGVIDPHLLQALLLRREHRRHVRPLHVLPVVWFVTIVALAGPAWRIEPSPFAEETSALVVVMDVGATMSATDVQPSRMERAAQKVSDLLTLRAGTDVALVAYAGSAHRVMPLTRDGAVVTSFASSLAPGIMPVPGDAAAAALGIANQELARADRRGSIVLITDGVSVDQVDAALDAESVPVHVLMMSRSSESDAPTRRLASGTGGAHVVVTPDGADVERLASLAEQRVARAESDALIGGLRDDGYLLLPLLGLLSLFWARRGWVLGFGVES